ncbi:hypothetical protein CCR78_08890, partial [Rhodovulum imhoffii]|nr:hypothetical protein [Rhodovulum imhoffii]
MPSCPFAPLVSRVESLSPVRPLGRVAESRGGTVTVSGLSREAALGDMVCLRPAGGGGRHGEILSLARDCVTVLPDGVPDGLSVGDSVLLTGRSEIAPDDRWRGRIIDPFGNPLDGRPLMPGPRPRPLRAVPPV